MTETRSRRPVPDRARKRAIRALATELGVAYSVAARLLTARTSTPAGSTHPVFPIGADEHRAWMFAAREHRTFNARVRDARSAAELPLGRAAHLTMRFPPLRATAGIGPLYSGEGRETAIAMLYAVLEHEAPQLLPPADELAWAAELGEDAGVDIACAALDRAARRLLDDDRWQLWVRVDAALTAGGTNPDRRVRDAAITLGRELRSTSLRSSLDGVRHTLDALLVEPYDCLPPGVRVRVGSRSGTVVGTDWEQTGSPTGYRVRLDTEPGTHILPINDPRLMIQTMSAGLPGVGGVPGVLEPVRAERLLRRHPV
ncbi:hypothetical protein QLQ12_33985 [Actinoplanes sp. NEAU-A12]|uniref:Uncharacterized protein n=1 Tax=Actinoplanes sandaracinus TaxID=3045177 RepID=A0ABT6WV86_9ACTN|nr:hypothetical protein [Actinoplanes sandaracinus]MDI6103635.1 hypothetical protein [Actinoplanes sandaracinus]